MSYWHKIKTIQKIYDFIYQHNFLPKHNDDPFFKNIYYILYNDEPNLKILTLGGLTKSHLKQNVSFVKTFISSLYKKYLQLIVIIIFYIILISFSSLLLIFILNIIFCKFFYVFSFLTKINLINYLSSICQNSFNV